MKVKNNTVILSPERETAGRAPGSKGLRTSLKAFPWLLMGLLICFGVMVSLSA